MKLLNVLIREILLFLDFKDIQKSRLHLVNKQFYHNIVEDNELIRRMFRIHIPLALDYEKERQFHLEITTACKNLEDEELKQDENNEIRIYDSSGSSLLSTLANTYTKSERLLFFCKRCTGGYNREYEVLLRIFDFPKSSNDFYRSARGRYHPNGLLCITGVSHGKDTKDLHHLLELFKFVYKSNPSNFEHNDILETLVDDANIPRDELEEELQMYDNPERAIGYKVDLLESLLNKEINKKVIFDSIKFIDHTNCNGTESLHSSLLNECKIIEFDTSPYDAWIRQNLFILRKIEGFGTNRFDTPTSSFAVLVHDFPMNCEDHPLSLLIKNIYQLFNSKPKLSKVMNQGTDQDEKNKNLKTPDLDDFSQLLQKSSNAGLIPDIIYSNSRLIEFDQKFYSSKFDPKHSNEEQKLDFSKSGIAEETEKVARLYEELETEMEYYRLRLVWIGYNLQDLYSSYKYEFKEIVAGRFVTFLVLGSEHTSHIDECFEFPNIQLYGHLIPSILQFQS
ncbi:unnamed protein product [Moneuplotes crassus]|uniref:F-box domain-containing protein n=1 Tax=Euplotes crassus TaxID=5936 RepID=A0AAD1Y7K4_EUPCR|nr:unnamed protein product [Moneuplotes crassus]